jgi:glycosyltransferase involved in cell wall biosynthesis
MISILIPVFNALVHDLVQELSHQLINHHITGEILVYDDGSLINYKDKNASIGSIKNVCYKELDQNHGRVRVRELLASDARYDWLLFIDSDSAIVAPDFLNNYFRVFQDGYDVYTGGRIYQSEIPGDCNRRLHWKYGRERESVKGSASMLHTNNFCIRKNVFQQLKFPQITSYGHEDTWVQIELEKANKKICFIKNPVLHAGVETSGVFLEKTKSALKNLLVIADIEGGKVVQKKVHLYKILMRLQALGLTSIFQNVLRKRIKRIEENLASCHPSLLNFDLYRLYYLIDFAKGEVSKIDR